ncbi:MAG TPA: hypothetical protein VEN78_26550 [Bradyrhizobium sp.]|nr:hypothetical protein [Bradyrhizobium sp.]
MPRRKKTFESELERCLVVIDEALSARDTPLSNRPLEAAKIFVKDFIKEIRGDTKERYYEKPWFASIFARVLKWYQDKYGQALEKRDKGFPAAVMVHGVPFAVAVPLTHGEADVPGETVWLSFETNLGRNEQPRSWIQSPPSLEALSARESKRLDRDLAMLTTSIRTINLKLMTASFSVRAFDEMRNVALLSLASAARHICDATEHSLPLAIWDLNYALENAMKCLILQSGEDFSRVHTLGVLLRECAKAGKRPFPKTSLRFLPNDKRVIAHRYGRAVPGGLKAAYAAYEMSLQRLVHITEKLDRKVDASRLRILLKRPRWYDQLPEFQDGPGQK